MTSHGKYPLREVHATLIDHQRALQAVREYSKHPSGELMDAVDTTDMRFVIPYLRPQSPAAPGGEVRMLAGYPQIQAEARDFQIAFSALNGYWTEKLHLRRINGKWVQALRIIGPTVESAKHPFEYFDPDFPDGKGIGKRDWPVATTNETNRQEVKQIALLDDIIELATGHFLRRIP
jgi:hypothetical protein